MHSITDCWRLFEAHLPKGAELPQGVDQGQIDIAESILGHELSSELSEFYFAHNGSGAIYFYPFEIGNGDHSILSLDTCVKKLQRKRLSYCQCPNEPYGGPDWKPPPELKPVCWHEQWLPFTDNGGGDGMFIDFAPEPAGTTGQVADWWHEGGTATLISSSVIEWFNEVVRKLEDGTYQLAVEGDG